MLSDAKAVEAARYLNSVGFDVCRHLATYRPESVGQIVADDDGYHARLYRVPRDVYCHWKAWREDWCRCTADNKKGEQCGNMSISYCPAPSPDKFRPGIDDRCTWHQEAAGEAEDE